MQMRQCQWHLCGEQESDQRCECDSSVEMGSIYLLAPGVDGGFYHYPLALPYQGGFPFCLIWTTSVAIMVDVSKQR